MNLILILLCFEIKLLRQLLDFDNEEDIINTIYSRLDYIETSLQFC